MSQPVSLPPQLTRSAAEFATPAEFINWFMQTSERMAAAGAPPEAMLAYADQYITAGSMTGYIADDLSALITHWQQAQL